MTKERREIEKILQRKLALQYVSNIMNTYLSLSQTVFSLTALLYASSSLTCICTAEGQGEDKGDAITGHPVEFIGDIIQLFVWRKEHTQSIVPRSLLNEGVFDVGEIGIIRHDLIVSSASVVIDE